MGEGFKKLLYVAGALLIMAAIAKWSVDSMGPGKGPSCTSVVRAIQEQGMRWTPEQKAVMDRCAADVRADSQTYQP